MAIVNPRPIVLSAKRGSWRVSDSHASEADSQFHEVRSSVLERDDYTCVYCLFRVTPQRSKKGDSEVTYQEVHHLDDDHSNNKPGNLVTACCLCHQCFHVGLAGKHGGGKLIWLPEIRQSDLNNLVRAIFVAMRSGGDMGKSGESIYTVLESRAAYLEEFFGQGSSNPGILGQAMLDMTDEAYEQRAAALSGVRLLARPARFMTQIDFWRDSAFKSVPPDSWEQVTEGLDLSPLEIEEETELFESTTAEQEDMMGGPMFDALDALDRLKAAQVASHNEMESEEEHEH